MRVGLMGCATSLGGPESSRLGVLLMDALRRQSIGVVYIETPDGDSRIPNGAFDCDALITFGWPSLAACEARGIVPQMHAIVDFGAQLKPSGTIVGGRTDEHDLSRKIRLLNQSPQLMTGSEEDVRWLRTHGRFAQLLVEAPLANSSFPVETMRARTVDDIVDQLADEPGASITEESMAGALRMAIPRVIPSMSALLDASLRRQGPARIQTVNLQHLYLAKISPAFRRAIATADGITADGWPVVQMLRGAGLSVERATGADLIPHLLSDPRVRGLRIALVGGARDPGEKFATLAAAAGATVVLRDHRDKRDWEPVELADRLNEAAVDLTLVAVTQPVGDLLAVELIRFGYAGTAIGIGAAVEMFVGGERRAAAWVQSLRLEWLYRFVHDPVRLWRRYCLEGMPTYIQVVLPMIMRRELAVRLGSEAEPR